MTKYRAYSITFEGPIQDCLQWNINKEFSFLLKLLLNLMNNNLLCGVGRIDSMTQSDNLTNTNSLYYIKLHNTFCV